MKKLFFILVISFCIFSYNLNYNIPFSITPAIAETTLTQDNQKTSQEDILDKPIFQEEQKLSTAKQFSGKLSSIIIKIFGGVLLLLVGIICLSFIWFANLQRKKDKKRKKTGFDSNVINAVENFAKLRIKE